MKKLIIIALFLWSTQLRAQILNIENYRIKTDTIGWAGKLGLDFSLTKNTHSLTKIGSNIHVQYKTKRSLYLLLGQYQIFISDGSNLIDKSIGHLRYNYKFTPKIVGELFLQLQRNSVSKIELRSLLGTGMRFKLSNNKKYRFYLGSAVMYEHEKSLENIIPVSQTFRWSNYFSTSLYPTKSFTFISTTYYQPAINQFSDYRLLSQNSLIFSVSKHISFKTSLNIQYDSDPIPGIPNLQYGVASGLIYIIK